MKFTFLTLLLFNLRLMSVVIADDGPPATSCCLFVSKTKVQIADLLDYYIQNISTKCPIKAIRFRTKKNKTICSDPEDKWAKKAIAELDRIHSVTKKPDKEPYMCDISISTKILTTSTTIEKPGPKTEISTSTVTSKDIKTTAIKTTRPETETSTSTETTVTTVPSTVTTFKTTSTRLQTETRTTTTKPTTVSTKGLKSSANPCSPVLKRTRRTTSAPLTTVTSTTVKITFSTKYKMRRPKKTGKRGKGKTGLRRFQMRLNDWDKAKNN